MLAIQYWVIEKGERPPKGRNRTMVLDVVPGGAQSELISKSAQLAMFRLVENICICLLGDIIKIRQARWWERLGMGRYVSASRMNH